MTTRTLSQAAMIALAVVALVTGCASQKQKQAAMAVNPAQVALDAAAQPLKLTPDQEAKLATVFRWQDQQTTTARPVSGKTMLFTEGNGEIIERTATMDDVYKYDDGKGMPTDPTAVRSATDVRIRSIMTADQYAAYKNQLTSDERATLAKSLREGLRSSPGTMK
jgi:hypothetical protein